MSGKNDDLAFHFVCTFEEAVALIEQQTTYFVSNCGCRENRGKCERSRMDVCLIFSDTFPGSGTNKRPINLAEARGIWAEARASQLVPRPYRNMDNPQIVEGLCFCCDDCCSYFLEKDCNCDKGRMIESTGLDKCNSCGICIDVCYFKAREISSNGIIRIDQDNCYGCGLCAEVCPVDCVRMVER